MIRDIFAAVWVTVAIPASRAAVALALITTVLERWANTWLRWQRAELGYQDQAHVGNFR